MVGGGRAADAVLPVVAAKLRTPRVRPETIPRHRLTELLDDAARRPLTVVSAPAGYGKTTAIVEWLARDRRRCGWVSVDALDNDPRRLCAHLLAALDRALPGAMDDARRALAGGSDLDDTVVPLAVNALDEHADHEVVLVVDDYHHVEHQEGHALLVGLIDRAPPNVHFVVASRTAPPLRLGRRRTAGMVAEIAPEQLAFRPAESEQLLNGSLDLDLTTEQLTAIDERVRGWAAGLSLVVSSLPARPDRDEFLEAFTRSRATVAEYLIEEVLDACEPALRAFLRRTSILRRLCAPLCEAVLDDPAAGALVEEVRRSNLFVTVLDGDERWMRYHDVFADLLRGELRAREPGLIAELHLRASRWHEQAGLVEEAIEHANAAGDGPRAARLMYEHGEDLLHDRRYVSICRLIDAMPPERGVHGPYCRALYLLAIALDGASLPIVYEGLRGLKAHYDAPGVERIVEHTLISPFFGHVAESARTGRAFLDRARDEPPATRAAIAANLGVVMWFAGEAAEARALLEPYLDAMIGRRRNWARAVLAFIAVEQGQQEIASSHAEAAVAEAEATGGESALEYSLAYQARGDVLRSAGRHGDADRVLAHAARVTSRFPGSLYFALTMVLRAELELARNDRSRARSAAVEARAIIARYPDVGVLATRLEAVEAGLERRGGGVMLGSQPTPAELRLLALLEQDLTLREIASEHLYVSFNTVRSHAQRLYRRLGVRTRAEAITVARGRGLL
jgi:LuxR family maltose regulon positive regulatory protein